ncbi:hypothetical protein [Sphingomonas xinjiangensis]|uniref:Uncharacterized protein n=1 Tax=Sphingomonas xinjiangensis TaxID=643568 RepID=A0A840YHW7_9SPHN|nr:hypothetical protein [Sphingomonas xinjiangensis]MBB5711985.1 hypothetical protein [Sphingomonas xinjiangensis]
MLLALAMFLTPPAQAAAHQEVVITSDTRDQAAKARHYVERISEPLMGDAPLARFTDPVCVGSAGLPRAAGQAVVDRVSEVAASIGLRVGETGCAPNLIVAFVEDSRAAVRRLARANSVALNSQSLADVARIVREPGHARAWIEVETRSRDGDRPVRDTDDPKVLRTHSPTRLSSPTRRDVVSATVLIDRGAMAGRSLAQVADYAAMRALTGAKLRGQADGGSILALFTPEGDARAPATLSAFDRAYLEGLYAGRGDLLPRMKKNAIVSHMVRGPVRRGAVTAP